MSVACDRYGFFNGVYGLEQSNWANYWRGIIPDGVLAQQDDELKVTTSTSLRMGIRVKRGQAMVDNHRVWVSTEKELEIAQASSANGRIDMVVVRVTYGNDGESIAELDVKTGVVAANPVAPTPTKVTGGTYEIPLALINVAKNKTIISASDITDIRYVYKLGNDSVTEFTTNSVTCTNDIEYRNSSAINSLTINLPGTPNDTYITGVCFTTSSSFSGVSFTKGGSGYNGMKIVGDALSIKNKRYNLVIWWDSGYGHYWCISKAVTK